METLSHKFTLNLADGSFPLGTDSMLLADFVRLPRNAAVLDLGSGCGTLGMLLCAKDNSCQVTGIELSETDHCMALENIQANQLQSRLYSLCADLKSFPPEITPGSFHCCVSNPPYFTGGEASKKHPLARRDDACKPSDLFAAAAKALRYGGDFFLVHKPERLAQLCYEATIAGLQPKRLRLVRHTPNSEVTTILLQCRKGGKVGLVWEELYLKNTDGSPSDDYRRIYHL